MLLVHVILNVIMHYFCLLEYWFVLFCLSLNWKNCEKLNEASNWVLKRMEQKERTVDAGGRIAAERPVCGATWPGKPHCDYVPVPCHANAFSPDSDTFTCDIMFASVRFYSWKYMKRVPYSNNYTSGRRKNFKLFLSL